MSGLSERETCWTMIRRAADGDVAARDEFARCYSTPVRLYFAARWQGHALAEEVSDAVQEVFLDCFRSSGALGRADPERSFRGYLLGVSRVVALRTEERLARDREMRNESGLAKDVVAREDELSTIFDREWARSVMRRAAELQSSRAIVDGPLYRRRVELLRLRFEDGLSIREIAELWNEPAARLHHEYARARDDFRSALLEVIGLHGGSSQEQVESEARRLIGLVSGGRNGRE